MATKITKAELETKIKKLEKELEIAKAEAVASKSDTCRVDEAILRMYSGRHTTEWEITNDQADNLGIPVNRRISS